MQKTLACIVLSLLYSSSAYSQCRPQDFLKSDTVFSDSSATVKWSYLNSFSREKFEEMKRNGHLYLNLPKVPLITKLDYDDFKRVTENEVSSQKQHLTSTQSETIYRNYLSPEGVKAYMACLQDDRPYVDITLPPEALTDSEFFATLTWRGPRGVATGRFDNVGPHHFQIIGGEIPDEAEYDRLESLKNGQSYEIKVRRDLSKNFSIASSVDGLSSKASLPPKAEPSKITFDVAKSDVQTAYGDGLNAQHNQFCISAKNNETFLASTLTLLDNQQVPSNGKAWTDLAGKPDDKHICATAHAELYPGKHRTGAAKIWSHIEVLRMTDPDKQP